MPGQILLPAHGPTGESYTSRTTVIVIVGADSHAILSARTSHAAPRHAAFSPRARLVIVCTDSGILCGTVSGAISHSRTAILPSLDDKYSSTITVDRSG
ncbi:hypothetical protein ALC60_14344 [Trachymyrmex zeteki]|uniref:Uncharacterized protein n=1 Tax=Mycetomoellerius zeteki TaxID=64791 RepID=A0A151WFN2_9HYME|nr:hypothetical protein ALC60_14344 [Trachymyrmex zeteki]